MKKIIAIFMIMLIGMSLVACSVGDSTISEDEGNLENEGNIQNEESVVKEKTWQDDASNKLVTEMFYYGYERGYGIEGYDAIGQTLDNILVNVNCYYEDEVEKNLFFDKYIELYKTHNIDSETTKQRDLYDLYVYMIYSGYSLTTVKDVYSVGYNADGSNNLNVLGDWRAFILDISGEIIVVTIGKASSTFGIKKFGYEEFNDKFKTTLSQQDGTFNGIYLQIGELDDYPYKYENPEILSDVASNEMMMFLTEYISIYKSHRYELFSEIEDKTNNTKPSVGMDKTEVENSAWGKPDKVNKTETKYGTHEQWVYGNGKYVYFENGEVVSIQESY